MKRQSQSNTQSFTLTDNTTGKTYELPVLQGSVGPNVIDVRQLYSETGHFTYDPGYTSTGSCESRITYIDGEQGILLYRGYPIQELAKHSDYLEVCYLLLYGDLPTGEQKTKFEHGITNHTMLHEQVNTFYRGFRRDSHPMAIMCGVVGALSALRKPKDIRLILYFLSGISFLSAVICGCSFKPTSMGRLGPYISRSRSPTRYFLLIMAAIFIAIVDFPTPPFPLAIAIIFSTPGIDGYGWELFSSLFDMAS